MANRPGSIFGSYGSQQPVIEINEKTIIETLIEEEEEIVVEVEDTTRFINDYEKLKNKPRVKWGEDGEEIELEGSVDLKTIVPGGGGGGSNIQRVECLTLSTDPNKTVTYEGFSIEPDQWFEVRMQNINTAEAPLTLSINGEEPKSVTVNGQPIKLEEPSNNIGKGINQVYYNGKTYDFRNDAGPASAQRVTNDLVFEIYESTPIRYNGSEEITIGAYAGVFE